MSAFRRPHEYVGKRAAFADIAGNVQEGLVLGYCDEPAYIVERADGSRVVLTVRSIKRVALRESE